MGKLADQARAALDSAREDAKIAWADFEEAKQQAIDSEEEMSEAEADALEGKHAAYQEKAQLEEGAEKRWERLVAIEGSGVRKTEEPENGNGGGQFVPFRQPGKALELATPGSRFVGSEAYKGMIASGVARTDRARIAMTPVEVWSREEAKRFGDLPAKALISTGVDAQGGYLTVAERLPDIRPAVQVWPTTLLPYIPRSTTDTDAVEWVEFTGTNAAAPVAQAIDQATGLKPESSMTFAVKQLPVQTIAHWIAATRQAIQDASRLSDMIDQFLRSGIETVLENQILNGDGTAPNLRGIMNTVGINTVAPTAIPYTEAIHAGISAILADGYQPNLVVMNPADFGNVRLAKDTTNNYYYGPPSQVGPTTMWGLPILQTPRLAAGFALVGDFQQCTLWVREGVVVTASSEHADFFIRNLVAVLAEGRWAFGVMAPQAFASVDLVV